MRKINIGKYSISKNRTFITFEAGATHNGLRSSKKLVDIASSSGADAIKFQLFNKDDLLSDKNQIINFKYFNKKNEILSKRDKLYKIFERRQLSESDWIKLKKYADKKKILFFLTVGGLKELKIAKKLKCPSIKIASGDISFYPLIREVAKLKTNIQLDTGNSTTKEIIKVIKLIEKYGNKNIIIHYCPPGYPARYDDVAIKNILKLKKIFKYPIAYSDHSPNFDIDIVALTLGVPLIEKTITENKYKKEIEHMFSLEKKEAITFVNTIRNIEKTLQVSRYSKKDFLKSRFSLRRSVYVKENVTKGNYLKNVKVKFMRPENGITPIEYEKMKNFRFNINLSKDSVVKKSFLNKSK